MKRLLIAMCMTALVCLDASGQAQDKKSGRISKAEREVTALNLEWADSITKGNAASIDRLFADEMIVTSGSGEVRSKAQEMKDLLPGPTPDPDFVSTRPFITEDVRVKIYGDAALVTGLAKWGFKYEGQEVSQERRYTHMYVKRRGRWMIVAQQISSNLYKKPQA